VLFIFTVIALLWANSPWAGSYTDLWQAKFTIGLGSGILSKPLLLWVNDGLMAIFFFVVGLEIKREMLTGELTSFRKAALSIAAAIGGMIIPALLYLAFNSSGDARRGWGIPMATDIAFSLGVLQLLGSRVPLQLKIFLTAFAIVDDIGAVLVIALFYTAHIAGSYLLVSALLLIGAILINIAGVRRPLPYALLGVVLWFAVLKSGVHATVAGVALAMAIPARTRIAEAQFLEDGRELLREFEGAGALDIEQGLKPERHSVVNTLQELTESVQSPLQRLEDDLHPWVAFLVLPVFALANAGVSLAGTGAGSLLHPISLGIIVGLLAGKFIGVSLFAYLSVKLNIAALPTGVTWRHIMGVALLGRIGFTMSLFVANLAFGASELLNISKLGILCGSFISGLAGVLFLLKGEGKPA